MRAKFTVLAAFGAAAILAGPALAQDDGYGYRFHNEDGASSLSGVFGLRGSFAFTGQTSGTEATAPPTRLHSSYDNGGGGSIYVGTRLPLGLRLDLEGLYRYLPAKTAVLNGASAVAHGNSQVAAPMVNLMWELPFPSWPVHPVVGAGVGAAYVDSAIHDAAGTTNFFHANDWQLAYQLMGGLEFPMGPTTRMTAMYRWLQINDVHGSCGSGAGALGCHTDLNSQSVDLGLEMDM